MDQGSKHQCASFGMKMSILCALIGAAVPAGMMLKEFLQSLPGGPAAHPSDQPKWPILIGTIVTVIGLTIVAALLGRVAGKIICRRKSGPMGAILIGICLALACVVVGVMVGVLFTIGLERSLDAAGVAGAFGLATLIVGAIPATLLGVLYGTVVRWRVAKVDGWENTARA